MSEAYREEARERLKNCEGARFSAEALVIALAGGRIGQSDWSVECDRIISLLNDDDDYGRGFKDGLKANTKAAFAAAKQAISERTCEWVLEHSGTLYDKWRCSLCGYLFVESCTDGGATDFDPKFCPECGAKVVGE